MTASFAGPVLMALLGGYLLGSVPFGFLLTSLAGLGDIRSIGSGNIGATNVLRTGNKPLAAATLLLDALKGTLAVIVVGGWIASHWSAGAPTASDGFLAASAVHASVPAVAAGLGAFLGHLFPVWLGFKGGKGVATYIGVLLGLASSLMLLFCGVWLVVALMTRYSSLSALIAAVIVPITAYIWGWPLTAIACAVMSVLLIWKHGANISRLLSGEEPRIGRKT